MVVGLRRVAGSLITLRKACAAQCDFGVRPLLNAVGPIAEHEMQVARGHFGTNGVVEIDLSKVNSEVVDISQGIPGMEGKMLSNWAAKMKEVLIRDFIPPEAIKVR